MRRHVVLIIVAALCLPLLVLVAVATFSTLEEAHVIQRREGRSHVQLYTFNGAIVLVSARREDSSFFTRLDTFWIPHGQLETIVTDHANAAATRRGFGPVRLLSGTIGTTTFSMLRLPFWPLLILLPVPLVWLAAVAYRTRATRGLPLCPQCGYDLSGCIKRCAECNWTMPYPLALKLGLRRDARRRAAAAASARAPRTVKTTKPTDQSVGSTS